ncbi:hypothetical protein K525DRAFT_275668 [Schizophyllum commune Loenen D]|nr:hypothetical protein K525DRAFT_275668 [Schizophyllum commune Loenen D]
MTTPDSSSAPSATTVDTHKPAAKSRNRSPAVTCNTPTSSHRLVCSQPGCGKSYAFPTLFWNHLAWHEQRTLLLSDAHERSSVASRRQRRTVDQRSSKSAVMHRCDAVGCSAAYTMPGWLRRHKTTKHT